MATSPHCAASGSCRLNCFAARLFGIPLTALVLVLGAQLGFSARAGAAPSGPSEVELIVKKLRDQGYTVVVSRVGSSPSDGCVVVAVRLGQTYSHTDHGVPGGDLTTTVTNKTVYVDVKC